MADTGKKKLTPLGYGTTPTETPTETKTRPQPKTTQTGKTGKTGKTGETVTGKTGGEDPDDRDGAELLAEGASWDSPYGEQWKAVRAAEKPVTSAPAPGYAWEGAPPSPPSPPSPYSGIPGVKPLPPMQHALPALVPDVLPYTVGKATWAPYGVPADTKYVKQLENLEGGGISLDAPIEGPPYMDPTRAATQTVQGAKALLGGGLEGFTTDVPVSKGVTFPPSPKTLGTPPQPMTPGAQKLAVERYYAVPEGWDETDVKTTEAVWPGTDKPLTENPRQLYQWVSIPMWDAHSAALDLEIVALDNALQHALRERPAYASGTPVIMAAHQARINELEALAAEKRAQRDSAEEVSTLLTQRAESFTPATPPEEFAGATVPLGDRGLQGRAERPVSMLAGSGIVPPVTSPSTSTAPQWGTPLLPTDATFDVKGLPVIKGVP